jgi:hypothetical protein
MPLNLNSDKLIVVVKPDQQPLIVTGFTPTVITGSGATIVTNPTYQHFVVYSPTGNTFTGNTNPVVIIGSGGTQVFTSGTTFTIFSTIPTGTTVTWNDVTQKPNLWTTGQTVNYFTGNTLFTFVGSGGTIVNSSQLGSVYSVTIIAPSGATGASGLTVVGPIGPSGLTVVGPIGPSGLTVVGPIGPSGLTVVGPIGPSGLTVVGPIGPSGLTVIGPSGATPTITFLGSGSTVVNTNKVGTTYTIHIIAPSGATGASGHTVTGPAGPSGNTVLNYYTFHQSGATVISATGAGVNPITVYSPSISGKLDTTIYQTFTGTTVPATYATKAKLATYTGTTAPATYQTKASIVTLTGTTLPATYATIAKLATFTGTTAPATYATIAKLATFTGTTAPATYATIAKLATYTGTTAPATYQTKASIATYTGSTTSTELGYVHNVTSAIQTQLNAKVAQSAYNTYTGTTAPGQFIPKIATISTKTGTTYTALSTDIGKIIEFTATGATTITLPTGLTTGYQITIVNYGNGTVGGVRTFAPGTGASIKSKSGNLKLSTVFDAATAYYRGSNVWVVFGDLTAT